MNQKTLIFHSYDSAIWPAVSPQALPSVRKAPMLSARVAAVTGSNKGIGFHIAQQLVQSGLFGCVLLACRNPANADAAAAKIRQLSGNGVSVECLTLDLAVQVAHPGLSRVPQPHTLPSGHARLYCVLLSPWKESWY